MSKLQAPFPWFGGKGRVAHLVWERFGDVANYIEPFYGSGAVLLARPTPARIETINDLDGFVANVWRSLKLHPEETAKHATNPVNECDLHARNCYLFNIRSEFAARLMGDPDFCDPKIAGWWLWGAACWIGSGYCSGRGPWNTIDGIFQKTGDGNKKQLPHLGNAGRGVTKQLPHFGNAGRGVAKHLPHLTGSGQGPFDPSAGLLDWFDKISHRLRTVRVSCGDWSRVMGESVTVGNGLTGVLLDPPYDSFEDLYDSKERVMPQVVQWCKSNEANPLLRIALCGYEGFVELPGWECVAWKAPGGYAAQGEDNTNGAKERIWFSPHCLHTGLF